MTTRPEDLADDVSRLIQDDRGAARPGASPNSAIAGSRSTWWPTARPTCSTPSSRAGQPRSSWAAAATLSGAICRDCHYRLGAATGVCPYCQGMCRPVNAAQEILRMAMRHRVPVRIFKGTATRSIRSPRWGCLRIPPR